VGGGVEVEGHGRGARGGGEQIVEGGGRLGGCGLGEGGWRSGKNQAKGGRITTRPY